MMTGQRGARGGEGGGRRGRGWMFTLARMWNAPRWTIVALWPCGASFLVVTVMALSTLAYRAHEQQQGRARTTQTVSSFL